MTLPMPRAVLFDWDGTLVHTGNALLTAHNAVRDAFGLSKFTPDDVIESARHGTSADSFKILYPGREAEALKIFYASVFDVYVNEQVPIGGALEVVNVLLSHGIKIGIVSNLNHEALTKSLAKSVFPADRFSVMLGAAPAERRGKPHPDPVYLALDQMGIPRDQAGKVWFVGDMATDEGAAKASGCKFVYFTGGLSEESEQIRMQADFKFSYYTQLNDLLEAIFAENNVA